MTVVHLVNYASQPDLQIWCDSSWTTPAYGKRHSAHGPYEAHDGRWYAFEWLKVTCPACLHKLSYEQIALHLRALETHDDT